MIFFWTTDILQRCHINYEETRVRVAEFSKRFEKIESEIMSKKIHLTGNRLKSP